MSIRRCKRSKSQTNQADRCPSCSITRGPDGTLRAKCFGCGFAGDVFSLVAAVRGLEVRRDFRAVLLAAAELGGLHQVADELRGSKPTEVRPIPSLPEIRPPREYPPQGEVSKLWEAALPIQDVEPCKEALARRGLFPGPELVRAISGALPDWARYQGRSWAETGHRILLPMFDSHGDMRSVRAWQVDGNAAGPKRLPPAGLRATGLVLANEYARQLLQSPAAPSQFLICEGEPDFASICQRYGGPAVLGVIAGSWNQDLADRIPFGSLVCIRTHQDAAGDKYADVISSTLAQRALVKRSTQR